MRESRIFDRKPTKHGTIYAYQSGCRCPDCRKANAAQHRAYLQRANERIDNDG